MWETIEGASWSDDYGVWYNLKVLVRTPSGKLELMYGQYCMAFEEMDAVPNTVSIALDQMTHDIQRMSIEHACRII